MKRAEDLSMKIMAIILCVIAVFCCFPQTADADVIMPLPGDFFDEYGDDCEFLGREYAVDSVDGEIMIYKSPVDHLEMRYIKNGEVVLINYTYEKDGQVWGGNDSGWVLMDNLGLVYDSAQFVIDNESKIADYDGEVFEIPEVQLYTYPNSGDCYKFMEDTDYGLFLDMATRVYTDENGNEWAWIGYYQARRDFWICIDDPTNSKLDGGKMENIVSVARESGEDTMPIPIESEKVAKNEGGLSSVAVAFVAFVALIAVFLINIAKDRKEKSEEE